MSWFMNATCMAGYACMKSASLQNMFCFNWCKLHFSWICCVVLPLGNHSLLWFHNSPPFAFLLWSMKIACMLGMHDISFSTEHVFLIISEYYYYYYLLCNLVYYMFCLSFESTTYHSCLLHVIRVLYRIYCEKNYFLHHNRQ